MEKPQMKMLDFAEVKLREFKKTTKTNPTSSFQSSGGKPSWLEELSKKQGKSMEVGEEPKKKEKCRRSQSADKENEEKSRNTG